MISSHPATESDERQISRQITYFFAIQWRATRTEHLVWLLDNDDGFMEHWKFHFIMCLPFLFLDVNDVKLIGRVLHTARNTNNATFLDVDTRYFNRYILQFGAFQLNLHPWGILANSGLSMVTWQDDKASKAHRLLNSRTVEWLLSPPSHLATDISIYASFPEWFFYRNRPFFYRNEQSYGFRHHELKIHDESLRELANTFDAGTIVAVRGRIDPYLLEDIEGHKKGLLHIRPHSLFACQWQ